MRLSPNFTLAEFTRSDTASKAGVDNSPDEEHLRNLQRLAATLERVRTLLGDRPLLISSGYRSPALNALVGGSRTSDHSNGLAADFTCPKFGDVAEVCRAIVASDIPFDQIIFEQGAAPWVHLGVGTRNRREVLSWSKRSGYVSGLKKLG
ncbi:D-Ala-D-Ala carboxypeptidase family metallohydrolase [Alcaligenaceae bacterium C4P045]|nr:D-Ala-D-Ala carboxypeptidase family metallohydrolase [Alcaligenaceae bacterium C4P045]